MSVYRVEYHGTVVPSGVLNGTTDGVGSLSIPGVLPPAGQETTGFAVGSALHWPAP